MTCLRQGMLNYQASNHGRLSCAVAAYSVQCAVCYDTLKASSDSVYVFTEMATRPSDQPRMKNLSKCAHDTCSRNMTGSDIHRRSDSAELELELLVLLGLFVILLRLLSLPFVLKTRENENVSRDIVTADTRR